tara:strand:+ start:479 stop:769 length:291 start_codon:yes stop_codon:yes gene_type:complete
MKDILEQATAEANKYLFFLRDLSTIGVYVAGAKSKKTELFYKAQALREMAGKGDDRSETSVFTRFDLIRQALKYEALMDTDKQSFFDNDRGPDGAA